MSRLREGSGAGSRVMMAFMTVTGRSPSNGGRPEIISYTRAPRGRAVEVVDGADAGLVERGRRLGFLDEALARLVVSREIRGQELQRDQTIEPRVDRFVDNAHAAATESFDDPIVRDGPAFHP